MLNQTLDLGLHEKKDKKLRDRMGENVGFAWMDLSLTRNWEKLSLVDNKMCTPSVVRSVV